MGSLPTSRRHRVLEKARGGLLRPPVLHRSRGRLVPAPSALNPSWLRFGQFSQDMMRRMRAALYLPAEGLYMSRGLS